VSSPGGRQAPKGGGGGAPGPAAARRLGLLVFGVAFIVLFAIVAISEGIGDPSVPSGDVALVEDAPWDKGEVTMAEFEHSLEVTAAQQGTKEVPKPGDAKYDELKDAAINALFETIRIFGLAEEWDIEVSEKEVADELKKIKKESFKTDAEFQKFLKDSRYTPADVDERVEVQIISNKLQERLKENTPKPSQGEIEAYYEAAKDTQFTQKPSRDVRLIANKDRKKAEEARDALSRDNSEANWKKVAKKYSEDAASKASGGLQQGVQEGVLEEPLNAAVFSTPEGQLEGPIDAKRGFTVFEVVNSTPESVQELKAVESQIRGTLEQSLEQDYFADFIGDFNTTWTLRTFCAPDYVTERCSEFEDANRPAAAPPACYEEDPKGGFPAACPAPVFQLIPALPGTVTPVEPKGKPLAQRPVPAGTGNAPAATELPPGAVPPPTGVPSE
jgi:parvulin-like peptidyl-prolyl isomerase